MRTKILAVLSVLTLLLIASLWVACSGGGSSTSTKMATVNVSMSDPPTCSSPGGAFSHVYVTIRDVQIHSSSNAGPNDSGWIDLTPDLKNSPKQVDLLGIANNQCLLAMLGSQPIQAGTYQQVRVYLSPDSDAQKLTSNSCTGNSVNCVVLTGGGEKPLELSSEVQTGIKIPSGQLAGGAFTVSDGQSKDLVIDFDACASIVMQGNGKFRLKPVLHAGEVKLANAISGTLVDKATNQPIPNSTGIVALERRDSSNVDRVVMQTKADANGNFSLCPVPEGTYDVVAVAVTNTGTAYAATIATGVAPGSSMGNLPLVAQTGTATTNATITGRVTTVNGSGGTVSDLTLYAMQQVSLGGTNVSFIIPLADQASPSSTVSLTTATGGSCAASTACADYTVKVPAMWPNIGAYSGNTTAYTQSTATPVNYIMGAQAFVPSSGGTTNCTPSEQTVSTLDGGGTLSVTAGQSFTAATMPFTGCQ